MKNIYWSKWSMPPKEALKTIIGGRLKGKTDINPQWRVKVLTEHFGMCGVGWKYTIDKQWTEQGAGEEVMAFVNISLYLKINDQWSEAIIGTGGSGLISKEKFGNYSNDEAFKMATTDAISVACKMIGIASDIYEGRVENVPAPVQTKYDQAPPPPAPAMKEQNLPWLNDQDLDKLQDTINELLKKGTNGELAVKAFRQKYKVSKAMETKILNIFS